MYVHQENVFVGVFIVQGTSNHDTSGEMYYLRHVPSINQTMLTSGLWCVRLCTLLFVTVPIPDCCEHAVPLKRYKVECNSLLRMYPNAQSISVMYVMMLPLWGCRAMKHFSSLTHHLCVAHPDTCTGVQALSSTILCLHGVSRIHLIVRNMYRKCLE